MSDIENRLRASMRFGVLDGSAEERGILGAQIEEAIRELVRLRARAEAAERELEQARADAARLRRLLESTAEGLDRITACGEALRQGGPAPEDLDELSDGLHNAVTEAGGLVDEIRAALAGEGEVEEDTTTIPFCACGRRVSECDGSRAGCGKTPEKAREA